MDSLIATIDHPEYRRWVNHPLIDLETLIELKNIKDPNEIKDRFDQPLPFGTAGLRGIIGAGINRMNRYTVRRATEGFVQYLLKTNPFVRNHGIAIAYDSRLKSSEFAQEAAGVLANHGIISFLYKEIRPSPMLSFAIRYLKAAGGIVITASHNSFEYNGYKVYGPDGAQLLPQVTNQIYGEIINIVDEIGINYLDYKVGIEKGFIKFIGDEVDQAYIKKLSSLSQNSYVIKKESPNLKVMFTPLHGAGNKPIQWILDELGYVNVYVVSEQEVPDSYFSTVVIPDPGEYVVFQLAIEQAKNVSADLIIGTDPDADRLGVVVKHHNQYKFLNGNQIGSLLLYYLLQQKKQSNSLPKNSVILKSIVTTELARKIGEYYGIVTCDLLPGFKYFAQKISEFEQGDQFSFLMGFEESNGYLLGDFVREKDAMQAAMLICEMATVYKKQGFTLYDVLIQLFSQFGFYQEELISFSFEGIKGKQKMNNLLDSARRKPFNQVAGIHVSEVIDYRLDLYDLPATDAIKIKLLDESWIVIRPSGTEPKIKCYIETVGLSEIETNRKLERIKAFIAKIFTKAIKKEFQKDKQGSL